MIVTIEELKTLIKKVFLKAGCDEEVAKYCAHSLTLAEICGVETHGIEMTLAHIQKINNGEYNIHAELIEDISMPSFARFNANNTIGMFSATVCMDYAIKQAERSGLYAVFAHHCNTFSAAFVYAMQAIEQGFIGIVMSNAPAQMPAYGGKSKLLGTNPIAFAIPANQKCPIIVDLATSAVAKSKIIKARDNGWSIPLGWALDIDGHETTNAQKALEGFMLPMGGVKGYALAMMIDIISGVLSGASYLNKVKRFYNAKEPCMDVGHVFIAINPKLVFSEDFYSEIDDYINIIHSSETIYPVEKIRLPGEGKMHKKILAEKNGYKIDDELYNKIITLV